MLAISRTFTFWDPSSTLTIIGNQIAEKAANKGKIHNIDWAEPYPLDKLEYNIPKKMYTHNWNEHWKANVVITNKENWFSGRILTHEPKTCLVFLHITWEWNKVQCWYWHHCLHKVNIFLKIYFFLSKPNPCTSRAPYLRHT